MTFAILLGTHAAAQVPFDEHLVSVAFDSPQHVFAIDLDSDGDADLISASSADDTIAWFESDGLTPPSFTEHVISTTADLAQSVFAIDVDDDGDVDVLSASAGDDKIAWYENDGASPPLFTEHVVSLLADGAQSVFATDVDLDGDIDVLSASALDDKIAWYENDGASPPGFVGRVISTTAAGARSVHAADVDGDGDIDVLAASGGDDTLAWYENDDASPPTFTERIISTTHLQPRSVFAADVDRDGDLDVLSASLADDTIAWHENLGGSPPVFVPHAISVTADGAGSVYAADVNHDGDVDVLSASATDDTIAWYENDGASPPGFTEWAISTTADQADAVLAHDVDGDGDIDVLSASNLDDRIAWYENLSPHPETAFNVEHVVTTSAELANSASAADVDGDGDVDVLSASLLDDKLAWYESDGGSVPAFTEHVLSLTADSARSTHATDLDGDGDTDVVAASAGDDTIAWYENDGLQPPGFTQRIISTTADFAREVHAADVDGDGDIDVLSASSNDDTVAWYENDGGAPPTFIERVVSATVDGATSVWAVDLDTDGDVDVLAASLFADDLAWFENDGAALPGFTERVISTTLFGVDAVRAADVDGDGDLDIVVASGNQDTILWFENDDGSPPAFAEHVITDEAIGAASVHADDLDGDGDTDVLAACQLDDKVVWFENDGAAPPQFTERLISTTTDSARFVFAADIDADGDLDALSVSSLDDKVAWHENAPPTGIPCEDVQKFQARCNPGGTIQVRVTMTDESHSGETVTIGVDGVPHQVTIFGAVAGYEEHVGPGFTDVSLEEPVNCVEPVTKKCNPEP